MTTYVHLNALRVTLAIEHHDIRAVSRWFASAAKEGEVIELAEPGRDPVLRLVNLGLLPEIEVTNEQPPNNFNVVEFEIRQARLLN